MRKSIRPRNALLALLVLMVLLCCLPFAALAQTSAAMLCGVPVPEGATYVDMGETKVANLTVFAEELVKAGVREVSIRHTGCMGLCHSEPTVEVAVPGMPTVIYGNVNGETGRKIVQQHIVRKLLVNDHIFDKPAADILNT